MMLCIPPRVKIFPATRFHLLPRTNLCVLYSETFCRHFPCLPVSLNQTVLLMMSCPSGWCLVHIADTGTVYEAHDEGLAYNCVCLSVCDRDDEWWYAKNLSTGRQGYIPNNYIAEVNSIRQFEYVYRLQRRLRYCVSCPKHLTVDL